MRRVFTDEQESEIADAYKSGASTVALSRRWGVTSRTINRIVRKKGTPIRDISVAQRRVPAEKYPEILSAYEEKRHSIDRISAELGFSPAAVRTALGRSGATMRKGRGKLSENDREEIVRLYKQGKSGTLICKLFGVTNRVVYLVLAQRGISARPAGAGGDTLLNAAQGVGRFASHRETWLYVAELRGHPDHLKIGIAFDCEKRKHGSQGVYGKFLFMHAFKTREEAFIAEQIILLKTSEYAACPATLIQDKWIGKQEVRKIGWQCLAKIATEVCASIQARCCWAMALSELPMAKAERLACTERAVTGTVAP